MPRHGYDCTDIPPGAPGGDVSVRAKHRRPDGKTPRAVTVRDQEMTGSSIGSGNYNDTPNVSRPSVGQLHLPSDEIFASGRRNRIPPTQLTNNENTHNHRSSKTSSCQGSQDHPSFDNVEATTHTTNVQTRPFRPRQPAQTVGQTPSSRPSATHGNNNSAAQRATGTAPGILMGQYPETNAEITKLGNEPNVSQGMPAARHDNRRPRDSRPRHGVPDALTSRSTATNLEQ